VFVHADGATSGTIVYPGRGAHSGAAEPTPAPRSALPFGGRYELVLSVAPECRAGFPDVLRNKVFKIRFESRGDRSEIEFEDPTIPRYVSPQTIAYGYLTKNEGRDWVTLQLYFSEEFLNPAEVVETYSVGGGAQGFLEGKGAQGHFLGSLSYSGSTLGPGVQCTNGLHDFVLMPI
jgi:hypothetical protein